MRANERGAPPCFQFGDGSQRTPDRLSGVGSGASALVAGWQVDRLHGYLASHIEANMTAPLALPVPPFMRMVLNDLGPRRTGSGRGRVHRGLGVLWAIASGLVGIETEHTL